MPDAFSDSHGMNDKWVAEILAACSTPIVAQTSGRSQGRIDFALAFVFVNHAPRKNLIGLNIGRDAFSTVFAPPTKGKQRE